MKRVIESLTLKYLIIYSLKENLRINNHQYRRVKITPNALTFGVTFYCDDSQFVYSLEN
ncbi:hypothetical protein KM759_gp129 [Lymphocystis disease virus 4]|uniref:Uncharacterized protein n=1 Tax=Lymphocystis disease virus 4 TaxID=2704413 RepID=A0A6B9XMQ2_9VIRU|nr:hypothetical protein KM759_gp129 [Lymphocystis disease virus 4]QHR78571.1 hypothetical protein [Lymphocystis disease virus 4]